MKNLISVSVVALSSLLFAGAASATALTKSQVRSLVQPTESQVKSCAQAAGVGGTLKVRFNVKADGSVADFVSLAPHKDDAAAKCAQDAITSIKFPESSSGRHSKYRFQLGGGGASNGISDAIHENQSTLSACSKGGKGSVRASFTIGTDGSASNVKVSGKHAKDDVGGCVSDAIGKIKFPNQSKPKTVSQTVKL